ncbi:MAG: hypothetical protein E7387_05290 [Ruminococcaceae bacterium]|nr:hypothetical protein [Oscillospiraceae bacterium]
MIRIQECKGVPVVCLKDEGRLGFIANPLYDKESNIKGFLLESENGFTGKFRKRYIALEDILKLNDTVCVVYSKDSVRKYENKKSLTTQNALEQVMGQGVLSKTGKNIGVVHDMIFDIETGALEGFELSKGFMNDMFEGRRTVFMRDGVEFGEEYIIARGEDDE